MVGPKRVLRTWASATLLGLVAGCSFVPKARLDDCHLRSQALQAETARLKDEALSLRNQNRDLVQRALDDSHRVHALETTNERLERSVNAYQEEHDRLVESFEQLERQVQLAADLPTTAMLERVGSYVRAHPETRFDAEKSVWSIPAAALFLPRSAQLRPDATLLLQGFANVVGERPDAVLPIRVVGRSADSGVRKASFAAAKPGATALGTARAQRVRDVLAGRLKLENATIRVETVDSADVDGDGEIDIQLSSKTGDGASAPGGTRPAPTAPN